MSDIAITTRQGALFVQPDGPNTEPKFLGCHDLGEISESLGSVELLRCMTANGGWKVVGQTSAPPDAVSTSIENLTFPANDYLDSISSCLFNLIVLQRSGGQPDNINNYVRAKVLYNCRINSISDSDVVHHEEEKPAMVSRDITAWPPVIRTGKLTGRRMSISESTDITCVFFNNQLNCNNNEKPGKRGWLATGYSGVYTKASIWYTTDYGVTWTKCAVQPFAVSTSISAITVVMINDTTYRIIVCSAATAGSQGKIAYSDDSGATWTTVNIGGATAAKKALTPNGLFALGANAIYLAVGGGIIYKSEDAGETWAIIHNAAATSVDLNAVFFEDEDTGFACGASDAFLYTTNGGESWTLVNPGSGGAFTSVWKSGNFIWIGTATGGLYYSTNKTSWTQKTGWTGSGTDNILSIQFANEMVGYMLTNNSGGTKGYVLVTITGGYTWQRVSDVPTDVGYLALGVPDTNMVFAGGKVTVTPGLAMLTKVTND